jgi:hypothetical protein
MIFPDTPEARDEIDRQLDPDDPVLLESDRNRVVGDLTDIARILIRTARSLVEELRVRPERFAGSCRVTTATTAQLARR